MSYSHSEDIQKDAENDDASMFENLYIKLRKKEQRLYSDDELRDLPVISAAHPHFKEWELRKRSCDRLIKYLGKKRKSLTILETGCGNGWLSSQLSKNIPGQVTGMDINREELAQATRVFEGYSNLKFLYGDIRSYPLEASSFDTIVFAASIQYFPSLKEVIQAALKYLKEEGEIHIIDTIFYNTGNVDAARQRTKEYYTQLGFPEAAGYYFHHCIEDMRDFRPIFLYNPSSLVNKFNKNRLPFLWLCIKKA